MRLKIVVALVAAVSVLLSACGGGGHSTTTSNNTAPTSTAGATAALPAPNTSAGSAHTATSRVGSSSLTDTASWVLQSCLSDNGVAPSTDTGKDMTKMALAYRACRDFLPPASIPDDQAKMYDCLRANGVDADPRMPRLPVSLATAKIVAAACSSTVPAGGAPPGNDAFVNCMQDQGAIVSMPIQVEGVDDSTAARNCAQYLPKAAVPPPVQAYWDCLNANGLHITVPVAGPAPPTAANTDVATVAAAAQACRSLRMARGPSADFLNCMEDHGVLSGTPLVASPDRASAATAACQSKQPAPSYPPGWTDYVKCLSDNGLSVVLPSPGAPAPATAEPAKVAAAARACRSLRPGGPPADYADCMEDLGVIVAIPVNMNRSPTDTASCSKFRQQAPRPPGVDQYEKCLNDHGLVIDQNAKPNYDQARGAFKACESLAPKDSPGD